MRSMRSTWSEHNTIGGNMRLARVLLSAALSACGTAALAQADYPHRAIRIVVPLAAGGDVEYRARTLAELYNGQTAVRMLHVPYKGISQAIVDVIGGQVAMMYDQVSTSTPHIKAGKLRALAVTSHARSPLLPEVPTVDEAGVPGYEDITVNGLGSPAGTPPAALVRINRAVAEARTAQDLYKRFIQL